MTNKFRSLASMLVFAGACSPTAVAPPAASAARVEMLPRVERPLLADNSAPGGAPEVVDAPAPAGDEPPPYGRAPP